MRTTFLRGSFLEDRDVVDIQVVNFWRTEMRTTFLRHTVVEGSISGGQR